MIIWNSCDFLLYLSNLSSTYDRFHFNSPLFENSFSMGCTVIFYIANICICIWSLRCDVYVSYFGSQWNCLQNESTLTVKIKCNCQCHIAPMVMWTMYYHRYNVDPSAHALTQHCMQIIWMANVELVTSPGYLRWLIKLKEIHVIGIKIASATNHFGLFSSILSFNTQPFCFERALL